MMVDLHGVEGIRTAKINEGHDDTEGPSHVTSVSCDVEFRVDLRPISISEFDTQ